MENLPSLGGGVYIYYDKKGVPLYVGQTYSFKKRHAQHTSKNWAEKVEKMAVWPCANESDRLIAETVLIFKVRPAENKLIKLRIHKDGSIGAARW